MTVVDCVADVTSEPSMSLPMGPFPARLRIGRTFDHIDVVACELDDTTGAEEAWEHSANVLAEAHGVHVARPGLSLDGGRVVITFAFSTEAQSIEFAALLSTAVLYAATMAQALSDDVTPDCRKDLEAFGIVGSRGGREPRWLLQGAHIAAWPAGLA